MNRATLMDGLEKLFPTIEHLPVLEELGRFRLQGKRLRASNGHAMTQVLLAEDTGVDCSVPAEDFFKLMTRLTANEVELEVADGHLKVKSGSVKGKFPASTESALLDKLNFEVENWVPLAEDFATGLQLCQFSVSKDQTRRPLTGVLIDGKQMVATDGFRIARFEMAKETGVERIVMSLELVVRAMSYRQQLKAWSVVGDVVYILLADDTILAGKAVLGDYPDLSSHFDAAEKSADQTFVFPVEVRDAVARHFLMQKELFLLDREVKLQWSGKELSVYSKDGDRYELAETVALEKPIGDFAIFVNPEFLLDILATANTMRFSPESPVVMFSADNYRHLVRLRETKGK